MNKPLTWDYTSLAESYHKRPNYPWKIIDDITRFTGLEPGNNVCDIGAGTGNLSILWAKNGLHITALEPNLAMYKVGVKCTQHHPNISWVKAVAEDSKQKSNFYDLVSFGSSFNVVDRATALQESLRITKPCGWLMMIWNHRDLNDPLQQQIEDCIKASLPDYDYGLRRQDQWEYLEKSGLFSQIESFNCPMLVKQPVEDVLEAWRSHATLQRQAGRSFERIVRNISELLHEQGLRVLEVPYTARAWVSRFHG
jgi:ubiquinone/menaquinone biosynthesis C-methylase UbiE